jgi:cell division topological specificity factor
MRWLDIIRGNQKPNDSAKKAKERLQLIVSRTGEGNHSGALRKMEIELLEVVRKYFPVEQDQVKVSLDHEGDLEVLELNITLQDS